MNPDKTSEKRYTVDDLLKAIDFDKLMAESEPMIEPEDESSNISSKSNKELDNSDFPIHYRMIRPSTKRIEEA